jgi:hypothetical protein
MVAVINSCGETRNAKRCRKPIPLLQNMEQIAVEMDYTVRNVHLLHKERESRCCFHSKSSLNFTIFQYRVM